MSDSWRINGALNAGGTLLDIASYVIQAEGIDFDYGSLFRDTYIQNPLSEGGFLAYDQSGVRTFKFPLMLASSGAFTNGLDGLAEMIRRMTRRPGAAAFIDLQPDGVATAKAVRFDILDGRLNGRKHNPRIQSLHRRVYDLELDVQPFGYLPTQIVMASMRASLGASGITNIGSSIFGASWNPASIIGDGPPLWTISAQTTFLVATAIAQGGAWAALGAYWSMGRASGMIPYINPSALAAATAAPRIVSSSPVITASIGPDWMSPGGEELKISMAPSAASWSPLLYSPASWGATPYWGRYRILGWFRIAASMGLPIHVTADVVSAQNQTGPGLASGGPVATIYSGLHGSQPGYPSQAYQLVDFGEFAFPAVPSSPPNTQQIQPQSPLVRIWARTPTTNMTVPTIMVECGGLYLLAAHGDYGILPAGLTVPSTSAGPQGALSLAQFTVDALGRRITGNSQLLAATTALGAAAPQVDLRQFHLGAYPRGASNQSLDIVFFGHKINDATATYGIFHDRVYQIEGEALYRPSFAWMRGM